MSEIRRKWVLGGIIMETLCENNKFKYFSKITFLKVILLTYYILYKIHINNLHYCYTLHKLYNVLI